MPKGLTAKVFATWLHPHEALSLVSERVSGISPTAKILDRLKAGIIRAAAEQSVKRSGFGTTTTESYFEIPNAYWEGLQSEAFWQSGDAHFDLRGAYQFTIENDSARCFGIRFDPIGIRKLVANLPKKMPAPVPILKPPPSPPMAKQVPPLKPAVNPGGRPRKEFWDDLLIAIFAKAWLGNWQPKHQADVEKAMLDWASKNNHELGETSVKGPAKKLFELLKK